MYKTPLLIKSFFAAAVILPNTAVKFDTADGWVVQATASTDLVIGYADELGFNAADVLVAGRRVNITIDGVAEVIAGGIITAGQRLTTGALGAAFVAAPAAGVNAQITGFALASAVAGDIIPVLLSPSVMQG